jgi:hypothetical protein
MPGGGIIGIGMGGPKNCGGGPPGGNIIGGGIEPGGGPAGGIPEGPVLDCIWGGVKLPAGEVV